MITKLKKDEAFTLIELIVVIAVIGILVLLAAPKFLGYTKDAKLTQVENDVRAYEVAIEAELVEAEVNEVDQLAEWGWAEIAESTLQEYVSEGSLFDKKGVVDELEGGEFYELARADLPAKSKLKGDFIYSKSGKVFYHESGFYSDNDKGEAEVPEGFTLLTDDDFEFIENNSAPNWYQVNGNSVKGYFHYKGNSDKVVIPQEIMENQVKDYYKMFYQNVTAGDNGTTVTAVISDNDNVTNMSWMFQGSRATTLDLSGLNTSAVKDMRWMFNGSKAKSLDLSSFNTSNVTDMYSMFLYSQAKKLDLSSFDTSEVTDMSYMFQGSQATTLDLSEFNTSNVTKMSEMFRGSQAITGYARTKGEADRFNNTEEKPSGLKFAVK